ncbi:EamA family transporter [Epibacterium sp. SM1979]|uniref:EamA family transporter n=1 Tax=Tritonibacter litoralis TaxID=2662264 RepID=A0A843YP06_9RHOB|nr:DMT family transporter [Tritonibacter litoralis]MQQ10347.1 EamA family transporter [Tritonibacter litoralis]
MAQNDPRRGITLMILTTAIFAVQDGISRHLASEYNVWMVVTIRYWFLAVFVLTLAARKSGGVRKTMQSQRLGLQIFRGLLLATEICVFVYAFTLLGLLESHAVFACYPLLIAALSGPILGESVGWRRWSAIGIGFLGVIVILEPGFGVFQPAALVAVVGALMFALYGLLTRYVARYDSPDTSFFYVGVMGMLFMTPFGLWNWEIMTRTDYVWMALLTVFGGCGHWCLIKCYEAAEASTVQPFAYLQLVFAAIIGVFVFEETLRTNVMIGTAIVVGAGLFTLWRERLKG